MSDTAHLLNLLVCSNKYSYNEYSLLMHPLKVLIYPGFYLLL